MAIGVNIGAQGALGFVLQPTAGTPVVIPASAKNWIQWTAKDLNYHTGQHAVEAGAGKRGTQRFSSRSLSRSQGGFTIPLMVTQGAALMTYFMGSDTFGTAHAVTPSAPRQITFEDQVSGTSLQYSDTYLDSMELSQSGGDWMAKYTVAGGLGYAFPATVGTPTFSTADGTPLNWGGTTFTGAFGAITSGEIESHTVTFANNVRQFYGAGSYNPTRQGGGKFVISGRTVVLFDSAAAAAALAADVNGTDTDVAFTVQGIDVSHSIAVDLPLCHITASLPKNVLADLVTVDLTWFLRQPEAAVITIKNDDAAGY